MPFYDKAKGCFPAQKLNAYYGKKPKIKGLPKEPAAAIEFCQNCKKPKRKCNGQCATLAAFLRNQKEQKNGTQQNNHHG